MHGNGEGDRNDDKRAGRAGKKPDPKAFSTPKSKGPDDEKDSSDNHKSTGRGRKRKASSPMTSRPFTRRGKNQNFTKLGDGFLSYSPLGPASEFAQLPVSQLGLTGDFHVKDKTTSTFINTISSSRAIFWRVFT